MMVRNDCTISTPFYGFYSLLSKQGWLKVDMKSEMYMSPFQMFD